MKCNFRTVTWLLTFVIGVQSQCKFPDKNTPAEDLEAYKKLKPLVGKTYTAEDPAHKYTFVVGICTSVNEMGEAGVVQITKTDPKDQKQVVIGKFTESSIMAGTNWILLQYGGGDNYGTHCNQESRRANILFTCDPSATDDKPGMKMLEEENEKVNGNCYYLFELAHPEICAIPVSSVSSLSVGSIILIVFFCVAAVYLIAGGLYQRFVLGAKGMEQIPNYEFWKDFGNLEADGCDFLCRSRDARRSSPYKGLGDDQLEEPEERDDNLLPM